MRSFTTAVLAAVLLPAAVYAQQVSCTKTTRLVSVPGDYCTTTYAVSTISCDDGTVYDTAPTLVGESCGTEFA